MINRICFTLHTGTTITQHFKNKYFPLIRCEDLNTFVDYRIECVRLYEEIILEEHKTDDGEEIDEDDCQHRRQQDRASVLRYGVYHIEQRLLSVHYVQQLKDKYTCSMYWFYLYTY